MNCYPDGTKVMMDFNGDIGQVLGSCLYSQVANRRGGRLLIFRNFSDPRSLLGPHRLSIFKKKFSLSENAYLTHI